MLCKCIRTFDFQPDRDIIAVLSCPEKKKLYIQVLHRKARQYDNNTLRLVHLSIDNCYIYNKTGKKIKNSS